MHERGFKPPVDLPSFLSISLAFCLSLHGFASIMISSDHESETEGRLCCDTVNAQTETADKQESDSLINADVIWTPTLTIILNSSFVLVCVFHPFFSLWSSQAICLKYIKENSVNFMQQVLMETELSHRKASSGWHVQTLVLPKHSWHQESHEPNNDKLASWWSYLILTGVMLTPAGSRGYWEESTKKRKRNKYKSCTQTCDQCTNQLILTLIPHTACSAPRLTWDQPEQNVSNNKEDLIEWIAFSRGEVMITET